MANPNIVNVSAIYGSTAYVIPSATSVSVAWTYADVNTSGSVSLTGLTPASGTVIKVGNIVAANVTSSAVTVTLGISNNPTYASGTANYIAYQVSVPPNTSVILVDKTSAFYVTQFQSVGVIVGTASAIHFTAAIESITSP
jgi:hypothetical protein